MDPQAYSDNEIFANDRLNAVCDYLFEKLAEAFPPGVGDTSNNYLYNGFILSGKAAAILQGADEEELKNIVFQTDKEDIYNWVQSNLDKIFQCQMINFKERTLLYPYDFFFEIWFSESALHAVEASRIQVQDIDYIPTETL